LGIAVSTGAAGKLAGGVPPAGIVVEVEGEAVRVAVESELRHPVRTRITAQHRLPRMVAALAIGSFSHAEGCRYFIPTAQMEGISRLKLDLRQR